MRIFFTFMVSLLSIRVGYHLLVKINQVVPFVQINDYMLKLALLIPYVTEVIFNIVIFYFNFMMPDAAQPEEVEQEQPMGPKTLTVGLMDQMSDLDSLASSNHLASGNDIKTVVSGSVRTWFRKKNNRLSRDESEKSAAQGMRSRVNKYHVTQSNKAA